MKRILLLFLLSLIAVSAVLTWVWFEWLQLRYAALFGPAAKFMFRQLGIHRSGLALVIEHFTNLVPFIALCLALPGVLWKKRLGRMSLGLLILAAVHFILIVAVSKIYSVHGLNKTAYKFMFPLLVINDGLPLAVWFGFFSEEIIGLFRPKKKPA